MFLDVAEKFTMSPGRTFSAIMITISLGRSLNCAMMGFWRVSEDREVSQPR